MAFSNLHSQNHSLPPLHFHKCPVPLLQQLPPQTIGSDHRIESSEVTTLCPYDVSGQWHWTDLDFSGLGQTPALYVL